MKIAIVGAGIGGLTAAALLEEQGHQVKVFEKNTSINELSAGIGIGDNVLKKLGHHDLAKGIKNAGQNLTAMNIYDEQGNVIGNVGQGGQAFVRGIEQQGNISIKWLEESKPVSCLA
ncbi:MAG: FimD/PapC C-terminal domain-containing protein, partial [Staphylococcus epidermidis]|nr:FimD/PapC C-terminal domain-containing protein [Staphylococcus epidermidis]